jgi:hypothetical protein
MGHAATAEVAVAVARSALAPANRRAALATGAYVRSVHHSADKPSPPARIVEHIPSRSITLIGTAPNAMRYSSARFLFGGFASMERPKLNLSLGPDAALIFMKGIGIPPRTKKRRVEKWEWQITVCTPSATMGISSTREGSPAITIPTQSCGQSS